MIVAGGWGFRYTHGTKKGRAKWFATMSLKASSVAIITPTAKRRGVKKKKKKERKIKQKKRGERSISCPREQRQQHHHHCRWW